jgi:hypothetical protein
MPLGMLRSKLIRFGNLVIIVAVTGILLGLNFAYSLQGQPHSMLFSSGMAAWDALVLAAGALLANVLGAQRFARLCVLGVTIALIQICTSTVLGYTIHQQGATDIKEYSQTLVYVLDRHKNLHGVYPGKLSELSTTMLAELPPIEPTSLLYYRDGDRFILSFRDPDPQRGSWVYDSAKKRWHLSQW